MQLTNIIYHYNRCCYFTLIHICKFYNAMTNLGRGLSKHSLQCTELMVKLHKGTNNFVLKIHSEIRLLNSFTTGKSNKKNL